ncbi:hypothetical protein V6N13_072167 [Hibiscus sabdariffa]|uniref:Uncharacterized protein n=1 Tax=Hibiscus sabdariffa TaxID=183260 RepID=A0ABR2TB76_9ROSI
MSSRGLKLAVPPKMQQNTCLELNNGDSSRKCHVGNKISGSFVFSALLSVLRPKCCSILATMDVPSCEETTGSRVHV